MGAERHASVSGASSRSRVTRAVASLGTTGQMVAVEEVDVSVKVVLEFRTTPDQVDAVKALFREVLPDTRGYEGCESLTLHQGDD